ncbi:TIGR02147 family protein [Bdellovibrio sp.]|uniref:TIGR02147 family protein n=1 Tax=Bdellovibrio sp. TaxID=28201 RepID=UPI0039E542F9
MTQTVKTPDLFTYLNVNQYLEDLYAYRKKKDRSFSYEVWAQELEFTNRSFLRQIVIGRRSLTEKTIKIICDKMAFSTAEREYFHLLVLYSKSKTQEQRNLYGRKLLHLIKSDYPQTEVQNYYEFLSTPFLPRLQTLLSFEDIEKSTANLSTLLGATPHKTESALQLLEKIKMAQSEVNTNGLREWKSLQRAFKIPDKMGDDALLGYHELSLKEAIQAQNLPPEQRRYKSLLLPLSPQEFEEFVEELQVFIKQALKRYDVDELHSRRLHQINFNIHAVSEEA